VRRIRREAVKGIGVSRAGKPSKKHAGTEEICGEGMDFTATSKHRTRTSSWLLLFFFLPFSPRKKKLSRTKGPKRQTIIRKEPHAKLQKAREKICGRADQKSEFVGIAYFRLNAAISFARARSLQLIALMS